MRSRARARSHATSVILLVALTWGLPGLASAQTTGSQSAMDYVQIEQLVNRLHLALDYCTNGGRDFADLFIAGGQYVIDQGDGKTKVLSTREQLIGLAGGPSCEGTRKAPRSYIAHVAENLVIELGPGRARGISYAIYPATAGKYFQPDVAGQVGLYFDEYVRTDKGWRFKSRRHVQNAGRDSVPPLERWFSQWPQQ